MLQDRYAQRLPHSYITNIIVDVHTLRAFNEAIGYSIHETVDGPM